MLESPGAASAPRVVKRGVLEGLKLAWKLQLRAKVIPVAALAWAEGGWAVQPQHPFIPAPPDSILELCRSLTHICSDREAGKPWHAAAQALLPQ